jgi:Skp family chaperone for outer membrane proteins
MKTAITLLILLVTTASFAQKSKHEKIKALKVAFITEQLDLTPKEAQTFWPIYNVYEDKMYEIHAAERTLLRTIRTDWDTLSEADAQSAITNIRKAEQQKMAAKETLVSQLRTTLSYKKTLILLRAEEEFKRKLLNRLRDGRRNRKDNK